jgi:hypothetical protein
MYCQFSDIPVGVIDADCCVDGWQPGDAAHGGYEEQVGTFSSRLACLAAVRSQCGDWANGATWYEPNGRCFCEKNQSTFRGRGTCAPAGHCDSNYKNCRFGYWCGYTLEQQTPSQEIEQCLATPSPTGSPTPSPTAAPNTDCALSIKLFDEDITPTTIAPGDIAWLGGATLTGIPAYLEGAQLFVLGSNIALNAGGDDAPAEIKVQATNSVCDVIFFQYFCQGNSWETSGGLGTILQSNGWGTRYQDASPSFTTGGATLPMRGFRKQFAVGDAAEDIDFSDTMSYTVAVAYTGVRNNNDWNMAPPGAGGEGSYTGNCALP